MPSKNVKSLVPKDILEEIKNRANESFTDDETGEYYDDIADVNKEIQEYINENYTWKAVCKKALQYLGEKIEDEI